MSTTRSARALVLTMVAALLGALFTMAAAPGAQAATIRLHPGVKMVSKTQIGYGWSGYDAAYPGDMTGDGDDDMVAVKRSTGELWLYPTDRSHTTTGSRTRIGNSGWGRMVDVHGADMNGDGYADIIAQDRQGILWLYLNRGDGKGSLYKPTKIGSAWNTLSQWVAVEQGPGGNPAIYAIDKNGNLRLYKTNGKGKVTYPHSVIGSGGWGSMLGLSSGADTDKDGRSEIMVRDGNGYLRIYSPNAAFSAMDRYVLGWAFTHWDDTGAVKVNGVVRLRAVDSGGRMYGWTAQYGSYSGYPPAPPKPAPKPPEANAVFVYGTLLSGQPNNYRLSGDYSSKSRTSMAGVALYRMSGYNWPWAVVRSGYTTQGEVYWLKPGRASAAIADLDRLEQYNPSKPTTNQSYIRVKRTMANGFSAWVYVAGPRTASWMMNSGSVIPSGDWLRR